MRRRIVALLQDYPEGLTPAEISHRLEQAGIASGEMKDMHQVWDHPQLRARDRWTGIESPAGRIPALFPPGQSRDSNPCMGAVPALGEQTDRNVGELGYDAAAIARLRAEAVV